jgi:poly(A) polymerase
LFGNCRLIGRRFRLAHVRFGREIIEVATFRATADHKDEKVDAALDHEGRILRDNVYGTIDEDVWRRDFTCNALYYKIADFSIWDYTDGVKDVERKRLVIIGDPETRLREDPVRMLRAVRFAAKLDFKIDKSIEKVMPGLVDLLANVPAARLFDEFLKLFQAGFAEKTFLLLRKYGLFGQLFPESNAELDQNSPYERFVRAAMRNTDSRVNDDKSVTPMFLIGVILWEPIRLLAEKILSEEKMSDSHAISLAAYEISALQQKRISIPRRFTAPMREMLALQPRFDQTKGRRAMNLLEHRRFRAAYDFMMLRAEVGGAPAETAQFWTDVQEQNTAEKIESFGIDGKPQGKKRRRRPRRRKPAAAN